MDNDNFIKETLEFYENLEDNCLHREEIDVEDFIDFVSVGDYYE